ncbi:MAG: hypothetical protein ACXVEE_32275 [Polyangiales bacterium]
MRFTSLSAIFVLALGCSSSNEAAPGPTDSGGTDAAGDSVAIDTGTDVGEDTVSPIDISGSLTITARVVSLDDKGAKVPEADFPARIENPGGGFIDGTTGADGVVTFKVDAAKGPFDVTVAKAGYGIVSVMGLTAPAGDIITYKLMTTASPTAAVTGTITGKKDPANKVQVDAWAFSTVVATTGTYSSTYSNSADLPLVVSAVEVDGSGNVINGSITAPQTRTGSAMKADVVLPATPNVATTKTLNVKFPTTGALASKLSAIAEVTSDKHLGNTVVVKSNGFAQMYVGVGTAKVPTAGLATISVQSFGGDMAPDTVVAAWSGSTYFARANIKDLTDGSTTTFGDVTTLDIEGTDLVGLKFATEGAGYEYSDIELVDQAAGGVIWRAWSNGPKLASRALPHLPHATKLADVGGDGLSPTAVVVLFHRTGASATPWSENASFDWVVSNATDAAIDPTGR